VATRGRSPRLLRAPWRSPYVRGQTGERHEETCGLCALAALEPAQFRDAGVLVQSQQCIVALNRYPYQAGHLLILPRKHLGRFQDLPEACRQEMDAWMVRAMNALEGGLGSQGINVGLNQGRAAGAGIADHLHWHLVPRWEGDHNFMPVLGETFVLPEDPARTFDDLVPWFTAEGEDS